MPGAEPAILDHVRPRRGRRRAGPMTAVLVGAGLLLSACTGTGGPKVASLGGSTGGGAAASPSATPGPLAFSQCMRSHGVPSFPDPDSQGRTSIQAGPGSALNPESAAFQAAQKACQSLQPVPTAAEQASMHAGMLKFAQCMRSHGIGDFPDPGQGGQMVIKAGQGSDLGPDNPLFQRAQKARQKYAPGGKGMGIASGLGGKGPAAAGTCGAP